MRVGHTRALRCVGTATPVSLAASAAAALLAMALGTACGGKSTSIERRCEGDRACAGGSTGRAGGSGGAVGAVGGGGVDVAPLETLASVPSGGGCTVELAVDDLHLYWTVGSSNLNAITNLNRIAKEGGTPVTLLSPPGLSPTFTLDRDRVYFATHQYGDFGAIVGGAVHAIAKEGGSSTELARLLPFALEVDDSGVYLTHLRYPGAPFLGVYAVSADTAEPAFLSAGGGAYDAQGLALDAAFVYWSERSSTDTIYRAPKTGGPPTTLVTMASNFIAVRDGMLYWVGRRVRSGVERMPVDGGPTVSLGEGHALSRFEVASDGTIFALEARSSSYPDLSGGIVRVDADGRAMYLAIGRFATHALAIDEQHVYFARCGCLDEGPSGSCVRYDHRTDLLRVPQRGL